MAYLKIPGMPTKMVIMIYEERTLLGDSISALQDLVMLANLTSFKTTR